MVTAVRSPANLFEPDILLPIQFHSMQLPDLSPEKKLALAILGLAVEDYQRYLDKPKGMRLFLRAESWIFNASEGGYFCSFSNICEILNISPSYLRDGLLKWQGNYGTFKKISKEHIVPQKVIDFRGERERSRRRKREKRREGK